MKGTPNGVAVRGLRVFQSTENRPTSLWRSLLAALLQELVVVETTWSLVTVHDGPHNPVARRWFARPKDAERARERFVELVADMSQDAYEGADWQAILDAV